MTDDSSARDWLRGLLGTPAPHRPTKAYFGCVDARLNISEMGIQQADALIMRTIGTWIPPQGEGPVTASSPELATGAFLEFFLRQIDSDGPKTIVVATHTDCGGLKGCRDCCAGHDPRNRYLPAYIGQFGNIREEVQAASGTEDKSKMLRDLEEAALRQMIGNLKTYDVVQEALRNNTVEIHGWILNTTTKTILVMDPQTNALEPVSSEYAKALRLDMSSVLRYKDGPAY